MDTRQVEGLRVELQEFVADVCGHTANTDHISDEERDERVHVGGVLHAVPVCPGNACGQGLDRVLGKHADGPGAGTCRGWFAALPLPR
jgi:hypothetical protein